MSTFEKYQELEKFLNKEICGSSMIKLNKKKFYFSKFNLTIDTFKNNFYKVN